MEVFEWYLGNADGSYANITDPTTATELPQFLVMVEDFVGPLYALLLRNGKHASTLQVFDKTVWADSRLNDECLWDGTNLEEIKRVNPELIRLLANVPDHAVQPLCAAWYSAPGVQDQVPYWEGNRSNADDNRHELAGILRNMIALSKRSVEKKKDVMERFSWPTK